jgi:hypothetical protein
MIPSRPASQIREAIAAHITSSLMIRGSVNRSHWS